MAGRWVTARAGALAVLTTTALVAAGCGDDDSAEATLPTLPPAPSAGGSTDTTPAVSGGTVSPSGAAPTTTLDPGQTGDGFVSINVRLSASGIDETLTLDRTTVRADELGTVSLDAACTALDGGEGLVVSVVDLRRLSTGNRLVSVSLRADGEITGAGDYEATVEVGDAAQTVTSYTGTVTLDDSLASGSFDARGEDGSAATGTFVCADEPVVTTTVPATGGGEHVPGSEPTDTTTSTAVVALPPDTIPLATA